MKKFIIKTFLKTISLFPLFFVRFIGSKTLLLLMFFSPKTKLRLKQNLLLVGIANKQNVNLYVHNCIQEWGMTLIESMSICWYRSSEYIVSLVKNSSQLDSICKELDLSAPILLLTPHIGNFEIALKYLSHKLSNKKFTVLYKPMKDNVINQIMLDGRTRFNIPKKKKKN